MEDFSNIEDHIDKNFDSHLGRIKEFIRQPTISSKGIGLVESAELLRKYLEALGCKESRLIATEGAPLTYAHYVAGAKKTLIIYMMIDTPPVFDDDKWLVPPFEGQVVKVEPFNDCIVARGAFVKASSIAFINALDSIKIVRGELPVNLIFVAEAEEILGSPYIPWFIDNFHDDLVSCDAVFWPRVCQDSDGKAQVLLGGKGMMGFILECTGRDWGRGPQKANIHSSNKSWVDSPSWRLMHALSKLTSKDGNKILIDGFYENVKPPRKSDLELIDGLMKYFDEDDYKRVLGVDNFIDDLRGRDLLIRYLFEPTLNLEDVVGGSFDLEQIWTHRKTVGVLYHKASAKMQTRLVADQTPEEILRKIRLHLLREGYPDIKVTKIYEIPPGRSEIDSTLVQSVLEMYKQYGVETVIWPNGPASPPPAIFHSVLGVPFLTGGIGHGKRGRNEYFVLKRSGRVYGLSDCEKAYVRMLYDFAQR